MKPHPKQTQTTDTKKIMEIYAQAISTTKTRGNHPDAHIVKIIRDAPYLSHSHANNCHQKAPYMSLQPAKHLQSTRYAPPETPHSSTMPYQKDAATQLPPHPTPGNARNLSCKNHSTTNILPICRRHPPYLSPSRSKHSLFVATILPICRTNTPYLSHHLTNLSPIWLTVR